MDLHTPELTDRVLAYLGRTATSSKARDQAEQHVEVAAQFVRAYVREQPMQLLNEELLAVIVATAARSLSNPQGLAGETAGPFTVTRFKPGDLTLAERITLDRYRVKAW